ncbi:protein kinase domain containing protein [Legionella steigerwaltii]|uniref:Protein kinase domain containing protein n=1 Tax=Legionella steigerwaltii TaxID=460 RepID=A0A378L788_9GAMM|nr:LegK7 family Dot/Icm T4SS effector kinase [Legionella steigerwaltii]KTD77449.1 protein kinase domain containing protein [Legionella steigerwaltii]STY22696.1 protein kinase domain containing protein [Legionella steigerwaltii]
MPLKSKFNRYKHRVLIKLIKEFNEAPAQDVIQRLFYLQKINHYINSAQIGDEEYKWLTARDKESWRANLETYGINPDGSFLFKGIQFARAVTAAIATQVQSQVQSSIEENNQDFYQLLQERDDLLKGNLSFEASKIQFQNLCCHLNHLSEKNAELKKQVDEHAQILNLAKRKISAIKGESDLISSDYKTEALGSRRVNNFNFKFQMKGWDETLVFRVEDRDNLSFEQELHSYPVSKYFANDVALFMMQFRSEDNKEIEYRPVVLSQYAKQGSLLEVVKGLKAQSDERSPLQNQLMITAVVKHYFTQINEFCLKLKDAKAYHPDIKLSNFLAHNNKLLISDRKALTRSNYPLASKLRCTPRYAPPQYLACLNEDQDDYLPKATLTHIKLEPLMSYQIGMALKEFLILTQLDDIPDNFEDLRCTARSHFQNPCQSIINLSILAEELTHPEEKKRLTIEQFQKLLLYVSHPTAFNKHLEEVLSSETLGITHELNEINELLRTEKLVDSEFLEQANTIFVAISERNPSEPRLNRVAEKLAIKCYTNYSEHYFSKISQEIEDALSDQDWNYAPWWRQAIHIFSLGHFRIERITKVEEIKINLDYNDPVFRSHLIQFEFLPAEALENLGVIEGNNLKNYFIEHLDEIRALNNSDEESNEENKENVAKEPEAPTDLPESSQKPSKTSEEDSANSTPSGTMIVYKKKKKTNSETQKKDGSKEQEVTVESSSHVSNLVAPSIETQKPVLETKEKPQHKKKPSVNLAESHSFFPAAEEFDENAPIMKRGSIRRVGSTLFRGEQKHHIHINKIFPPSQEKVAVDEHSTSISICN